MKCAQCGELQDDHHQLVAADGSVLLEYVCLGQLEDIDTFQKEDE